MGGGWVVESVRKGGRQKINIRGITHSTRWGWRRPARTRFSRWPGWCALGKPSAPACSCARCRSRPSAARCPNSAASRCQRSRCCVGAKRKPKFIYIEKKKGVIYRRSVAAKRWSDFLAWALLTAGALKEVIAGFTPSTPKLVSAAQFKLGETNNWETCASFLIVPLRLFNVLAASRPPCAPNVANSPSLVFSAPVALWHASQRTSLQTLWHPHRSATRRHIPQSLVNVNCIFYAGFFEHSLAFFSPFRHQGALRWWSNQVLMLQDSSCSVSFSHNQLRASQSRKSKNKAQLKPSFCTVLGFTLAENIAPPMINDLI